MHDTLKITKEKDGTYKLRVALAEITLTAKQAYDLGQFLVKATKK